MSLEVFILYATDWGHFPLYDLWLDVGFKDSF